MALALGLTLMAGELFNLVDCFILIEITWHMALSSEVGMGLERSSSITSSNVFTVFGLPACEVPFSGCPPHKLVLANLHVPHPFIS